MRKLILFVLSISIIISSQHAWALDLVQCDWLTPEWPHISGRNLDQDGTITIKTGTQGKCKASSDPLFVTGQVALEVEDSRGFWSPYMVGPAITKFVQDTDQEWDRNELVAVGPCIPGKYRGRLFRSAHREGGVAILIGDDILSPPRDMDCWPKRLSMVIDDTGSMSDDIARVAAALTSYINSQPEDEYTSWNLITFKDSPSNVITTEGRSEILSSVNSLTASGGGDCPEDVLGGISAGLNALGNDPKKRRQMLVATDAAAKVGDVDSIIAKAQTNGVNVNVLLRGDCAFASVPTAAISGAADTSDFVSSQVVLKRIAEETGGKYFFLPDSTDDQIKAAVKEIFDTFANPPPPPTPPTLAPSTSSSSPSNDSGGGGCTISKPGTGDVMLPALFLVVLVLFIMSTTRQRPKG